MTKLERIINDTVDSSNWDYKGIIESIIGRIENIFTEDEDKLYEEINYAINDELIYYKDQWTVLQEFCTPMEANWEIAITSLYDDVNAVVESIRENKEIFILWENVNFTSQNS